MKLVRVAESTAQMDEDDSVLVRTTSSISYDFVVSLRTLFNPRTFSRWRRWSTTNVTKLNKEVMSKGEFLFGGYDTALGFGAMYLIESLPEEAGPEELITAVEEADPRELAIHMLDTGETTRERLDQFRAALIDDAKISEAVDGLEEGWADKCRRVLRHPRIVQSDLIEVLDSHWREIYRADAHLIESEVRSATVEAQQTIADAPALEAIEKLTGGYTFGPGNGLRTVTMAASPFIAPFMSNRSDEAQGTALVIYGINSKALNTHKADPEPSDLSAKLKALSDPKRLTILQRIAASPLYTSEIIAVLDLSQTTVHHHLAQLRSVGLIRQRRDRQGMLYSIRREAFHDVLRSVEDWVLKDE